MPPPSSMSGRPTRRPRASFACVSVALLVAEGDADLGRLQHLLQPRFARGQARRAIEHALLEIAVRDDEPLQRLLVLPRERRDDERREGRDGDEELQLNVRLKFAADEDEWVDAGDLESRRKKRERGRARNAAPEVEAHGGEEEQRDDDQPERQLAGERGRRDEDRTDGQRRGLGPPRNRAPRPAAPVVGNDDERRRRDQHAGRIADPEQPERLLERLPFRPHEGETADRRRDERSGDRAEQDEAEDIPDGLEPVGPGDETSDEVGTHDGLGRVARHEKERNRQAVAEPEEVAGQLRQRRHGNPQQPASPRIDQQRAEQQSAREPDRDAGTGDRRKELGVSGAEQADEIEERELPGSRPAHSQPAHFRIGLTQRARAHSASARPDSADTTNRGRMRYGQNSAPIHLRTRLVPARSCGCVLGHTPVCAWPHTLRTTHTRGGHHVDPDCTEPPCPIGAHPRRAARALAPSCLGRDVHRQGRDRQRPRRPEARRDGRHADARHRDHDRRRGHYPHRRLGAAAADPGHGGQPRRGRAAADRRSSSPTRAARSPSAAAHWPSTGPKARRPKTRRSRPRSR